MPRPTGVGQPVIASERRVREHLEPTNGGVTVSRLPPHPPGPNPDERAWNTLEAVAISGRHRVQELSAPARGFLRGSALACTTT